MFSSHAPVTFLSCSPLALLVCSSYTYTPLALPSHSHTSRAPVTLLSFSPLALLSHFSRFLFSRSCHTSLIFSSRAPVTFLSCSPLALISRSSCTPLTLTLPHASVTLTLLSRSSVLVLPSCSSLARASLVLLSCWYSYCDRTPSYCAYAPPTLLILLRLSCCVPVVLTHLSCSSHTTSALRLSLWVCVCAVSYTHLTLPTKA